MGFSLVVASQVLDFIDLEARLNVILVGFRNGRASKVVHGLVDWLQLATFVLIALELTTCVVIPHKHVLILEVAMACVGVGSRESGLVGARDLVFLKLLDAEVEEAISRHVERKMLGLLFTSRHF
jgi:hypothetical protein